MVRDEEAELLHEELVRLPEKYRAPVILCHLEGLTHEEAAHRLRCPVGTLSARLIRARELLRRRLARRGVTPAVGLPVALAAERASAAAVSRALIASTTGSVMQAAGGRAAMAGATSTTAARLAEGVLRCLGLARLRGAAAFLVAIGVGVAIGVVATLRLAPGGNPDVRLEALAARFGLSVARPRPPRAQAPALATTEGPRATPGSFWVGSGPVPFEWPPWDSERRRIDYWSRTFGNPASPNHPKHADVACYVVEVEDGSLLVTLLHPAGLEGEPVIDYRPVVFDARGRRYLPRWEPDTPRVREFGARMPIDHFRLSPDILSASAVVSFGIERMTPTTLQLAQQDVGASDWRFLEASGPAAADKEGFEPTPGSSWQIAPFPVGRNDMTRFLGADICCDVVKSQEGSLYIYLACRTSGGGGQDAKQYRPALFDARRRRLLRGGGKSEWMSGLQDDPSPTRIAVRVHWIVHLGDDRGVRSILRPAAAVTFVGLERTDPAVSEYLRGAVPSTAAAADPPKLLDRSAPSPPVRHADHSKDHPITIK
jgi:hypothetical protein